MNVGIHMQLMHVHVLSLPERMFRRARSAYSAERTLKAFRGTTHDHGATVGKRTPPGVLGACSLTRLKNLREVAAKEHSPQRRPASGR